MGFVVALMGAVIGGWVGAGGQGIFGVFAGAVIAWLLYQLSAAQSQLRKLVDRIENLEQRNRATATVARAEKRAPQTPRVSIYEPAPVAKAPKAEPPEPEVAPAPVAAPPPTVARESEPAAAAPPSREPASVPKPIVHPRAPEVPPRPSMGGHAIEVARRWLTTGNVPVKVGVIISFFGVAFLLKFAVENEMFTIPMGLRYLFVAGFAVVLLALGWDKREENRVFALSIQGGGVGILYLTVFAAFRLHNLLSPTVAFALLIAVTVMVGVLAIKQESRAFAILGTTGGFLAPLLASTGAGNHVALFSYYLVLNSAVLGLAWYRPWRELNIIGFGFTFGIGTIWGYQYYVPELFATTEPFLILYFLFYTIIAVLFAFRAPPKIQGYVDGTLLFGTPTIAFALQTQLLGDTEYGLAISAAVVAAFYASMALWLRRTRNEHFALLTQTFIALALAFATVAIPLALDDRWTAIAWAMEGAALVWLGVRQTTTLGKLTGSALSLAAGYEYLSYGWVHDMGIPVLNGNFMGGLLIALAAIFSSRMLQIDERGREWQKGASVGLLVWGLAWWFGAAWAEISDRVPENAELITAVIYFGASFLALLYAANRLQWRNLWLLILGALPPAGGFGLLLHGWTHDLGIPVLNGNYLGGAMIAWMALYASRKLNTDERAGNEIKPLSYFLLGLGLVSWFSSGAMEIFDRVPPTHQLHGLLLFGSLSFAAIAYAGRRFGWIAYARVSLGLLPALFFAMVFYLAEHGHFFRGLGALGWTVAIAAHFWILRQYRDEKNRWQEGWHGWGAIFFVGLLAFELGWRIDRAVSNDVWAITAALLVLAAGALAMLTEVRGRRWPFSEHRDAYRDAGLVLIASYVFFVVINCFGNPGSPSPLPYIPILNPFDVLSIIAVGLLWYGLRLEQQRARWGLDAQSTLPQRVAGGSAWLLSTIAVVRAVHHFTGVAWDVHSLAGSVGVQSTLSIYWAILGLGGMVLGTRRANRGVWMAGAALMTVVVLKLFVVDLGNTGTIARIVSFLGVGVMLLVVGYFSPVPPKADSTDG